MPRYLSTTTSLRPRLSCLIGDLSGTWVDNWVISVSQAFVQLWKRHGVDITMDEARAPMGLRKDLHNAALAQIPQVAEEWKRTHNGNPITQKDLDQMFRDFIPIQQACLRTPFAQQLIPGTVNTMRTVRDMGLKIGMTTGFQRMFMNDLLNAMQWQGFEPDLRLAPDDPITINGADVTMRPRPSPDMVWANMFYLGVPNVASVLKIDDTCSGIAEGRNAGVWTCGLSHTSVYMRIDSFAHSQTLSEEEIRRRGTASRLLLRGAGAHYVVDDINSIPNVIQQINQRLAFGELP